MIAIKNIKFATSVLLGNQQLTHTKAENGVLISWDPEALMYILTDSKDSAKHLPLVWVHPTNVQYAVPEMPEAKEKKKSAAGK